MLELSILALIGLAAVYWTALWLMGRHEDVLYGDFVTSAGGTGLPPPPVPTPELRLLAPEIPRRPRAVEAVSAIASAADGQGLLRRGIGEAAAGAAVSRAPMSVQAAPLAAAQPAVPSGPMREAKPAPAGWPAPVRRDALQQMADPRVGPKPTAPSPLHSKIIGPVPMAPQVSPRRPMPSAASAAAPRRVPPAHSDLLASLLETIKRDLGDAVGNSDAVGN